MIKRGMGMLLALCLLMAFSLTAVAAEENALVTTVKEVDKYGNLHLDATGVDLAGLGWLPGDLLTVSIGDEMISAPLGKSYSDVDTGSIIVRTQEEEGEGLVVAINMGNLSETFGVAAGDPIRIEMDEPGGYLDEYNLRQLAQFRTYEREDYASDAVYANFRPVVMGRIPEGILYRSSSPANDEIARAAFANDLAEAAGIQTVINLADSSEVLTGYYAEEGFASDFYKGLDDGGHVIALDMGVDFSTDDFKTKLAEGLRFMAENPSPYLIHCNEGKDRAGFVAALLEALMGADADAIKDDYMESFANYYHVEAGTEQYDKIADTNILATLREIAGLEKGADLAGADLEAAAAAYIRALGLSDAEIEALEAALGGEALANAA